MGTYITEQCTNTLYIHSKHANACSKHAHMYTHMHMYTVTDKHMYTHSKYIHMIHSTEIHSRQQAAEVRKRKLNRF